MNWLICGTIPDKDFPLSYDTWHLKKYNIQEATKQDSQNSTNIHTIAINSQEKKSSLDTTLLLENSKGEVLAINRGTSALIASTLVGKSTQSTKTNLNITVKALLVGDTGTGEGSKKLYQYLSNDLLKKEFFNGITFHYLFPDVDWHNRVLLAIESQEEHFAKTPILVADAGFMYVAKMSGYADKYHIFTPDIGEMAFLADENAPHPFYTRGFLLAKEHQIPELLKHAIAHKNIAKHLIIKGETDYIVMDGEIINKIQEPSVPAMEAIGGTGDLVTGLLTANLIQKQSIASAMIHAVKTARTIAKNVKPCPATQIAEILTKSLYSNDIKIL